MLLIALNVEDLSRSQLETYYWDCDAAFMKGEMGGQDLNSCLSVTEAFQKYFETREHFMMYWHEHRIQQWNNRGYYPAPDFI